MIKPINRPTAVLDSTRLQQVLTKVPPWLQTANTLLNPNGAWLIGAWLTETVHAERDQVLS